MRNVLPDAKTIAKTFEDKMMVEKNPEGARQYLLDQRDLATGRKSF